ncbi:MerC family mercury resistance protein [Kiloniella laminariae]|uniref:MerC family mercury resistance protein n=1 Tax=Kiloniella laminariae TaxID=454162 RepID=UPI0003684777|nr:MerC family mercury resistance protein [Kiloniella laminariae]
MSRRAEVPEKVLAYQGRQSAKPNIRWIAAISTTFSFLLCYGTLVIISLLGQVGVAMAINDTLWAGAIVSTAGLALAGLIWGLLRHKNPWPSVIGASGALLLTYTMFQQYSILIELAGFILLFSAALWDWHSQSASRP